MSEKIQYSLTEDLKILEAKLKTYEPQDLNADLLDSIEHAIHSLDVKESFEMSDEDFDFLESHLEGASPLEFSDEVLTRMCDAMDHWEDYEKKEEAVSVEFSEDREVNQSKPRLWGKGMLSAAAAMLILGAITALVLSSVTPKGKEITASSSEASSSEASSPPLPEQEATWVAADNFLSHKVTRTFDTGIVYDTDKQPMRKIRVDYIEQLRANDEKGRELEINTPKCEYLLIPVETY